MPQDGYQDAHVVGGVSGVAAGTISLTKNVTVGMISTLQVLTSGFSQLFLLLSADKDYTRAREETMLIEKPKNFVEGFGYGCNTAVWSCASGFSGVISRPYVEIKRQGVWHGIFPGVYQGVTGTVLKPLSGCFDLLSKTAEGCKNTIRAFEVK
jgi:vacuolar protein sorting-associated protein 13A/C